MTNSYHVHVTEQMDAFTKLSFESQFQELSPGGAVSYVEVPNMENNIPAVIAVLKHIYENIMYAELNTKSDCCQKCGYTGEIQVIEDTDGKLIWKCPQCGNIDQTTSPSSPMAFSILVFISYAPFYKSPSTVFIGENVI